MAAMMNSCKPYSLQAQLKNVPTEHLSLQGEQNSTSKIAFFTFRVSLKDSAKDSYEIKLLNTTFAEGALKKKTFAEKTVVEPNYLYYQILGENSTGSSKHYERVQNPLSVVYESPADNGALTKTTITKKSGEMVIRFQYDQSTKSILIFKPDPASLSLKPIYHAVF